MCQRSTRIRGNRSKKVSGWKSWNTITAEGKKISEQISRDSQQLTARTEDLIDMIVNKAA